jgi:hypothetical protein
MNKEKALALANLTLGSTMKIEDVCNAYFSNDSEAIMKGIAMQVKDPEKIFNTIEQANYEIENEQVLATKSNFGKIQKEIVEQVISEENLLFVESNTINSPMTINETKECPELTAANDIVVAMKQNNLGLSKVA